MKIDLHCHTKRCKSGDSPKRNVDSTLFIKTLEDNDVKIVAITNHNCFDLEQYNLFYENALKREIQVWPGIEFDISFEGENGHILFISNPKYASKFNTLINELIGDKSPDEVLLDFKKVITKFSNIDIITIAHFALQKSHGFSENACKEMAKIIPDNIFLVEPSNIRSVGIMYADDIDSFIGSDVIDWSHYPFKNVPELKMPINSYESFLLLLKKDSKVIKTFLDQKEEISYSIQPFLDENKPDDTEIILPLRHDVNVIFGGKGTGKTKILKALKRKMVLELGESKISSYEGQTKDEDYKNLIKRSFSSSYFDLLNLETGENEFKIIKEWASPSLITTNKFYKGIEAQQNISNFTRFGFTKASFGGALDENEMKMLSKSYKNIKQSVETIKKEKLDLFLQQSDKDQLICFLEKLLFSAKTKYKEAVCDYYAVYLQKYTIETMKVIAQSKTGKDSIPASTGIVDFYMNCLRVYQASKWITDKILTSKKTIRDEIGKIPGKGTVFVQTDIYLDPNGDKGINYDPTKLKSSNLKKCLKDLIQIKNSAFTDNLSESIETFLSDSDDKVTSLKDFMGIKSDEKIEWENSNTVEHYDSSSGERSMLLLNYSLIDDSKEAYFLDEPEISVGHKYINEVIVPRLKYLAKLNKLIIISTHDANIAVRTFPLTSIYREYGKTYVGNLFIDKLTLTTDETLSLNWTKTSMAYLEGGEFAFKERKQSYGV